MKRGSGTPKFRFRRNDNIGAAAAEDDEVFLSSCFVDTGDVAVLLDCSDPKRIVLGRTGTGKTALLNELPKHGNTIEILPENLSFGYLSNSGILRSLMASGVNLDLFFKLLWRHVFVVELLKEKFHIVNEAEQRGFLERIAGFLRKDKRKERAVEYLMHFGGHFWDETEYRVKEITNKFSDQLKSSLGAKFAPLAAGVDTIEQMSSEEKLELNQLAQTIVNEIQVKELLNILTFLNEDVFNDAQNPYYITIDRLDENWIEDKFKLQLIRSLIESVREFNKVHNVKIIVALRNDLIDRVFRRTRDGGFQEEKYRSLYLPLRWTQNQLKKVLDRRVGHMIRTAHPGEPVSADQFLPNTVSGVKPRTYMLERTLGRPRELIEFFNLILENAEGETRIPGEIILKAESTYSRNRLRSLQDEWYSDYPKLIEFAELLKKRNEQFKLAVITAEEVVEFCLGYVIKFPAQEDSLSELAKEVASCTTANQDLRVGTFLNFLFQVFYKTGIVGIKTDAGDRVQWSYLDAPSISASTLSLETSVRIHPTFWRVLGTTPVSTATSR